MELAPHVTDPIVQGIDGGWIKCDDESDDKGYAFIFIPESLLPPHRVTLKSGAKDQYYFRTSNSFIVASHVQLEDMFGRRPKPKLVLNTQVRGKGINVSIIIGIKNEGRGSATAPYLAFSVSPPFHVDLFGLNGNRGEGMKKFPDGGTGLPHKYGEDTSFIIHSGLTHDITKICLGNKMVPIEAHPPNKDLLITYEMTADGITLDKGEKIITLSEMGF